MVEAFTECLADSGVGPDDIQAAWLGTCLEEVNVGKSALPLSTTLRLPFIPVTRVENFSRAGPNPSEEQYMLLLPALMTFAWPWEWKS